MLWSKLEGGGRGLGRRETGGGGGGGVMLLIVKFFNPYKLAIVR